MIRPAARRSVGWVGPPSRLDGHAVLDSPSLSAGSDIAILAFEGDERAPADSWARLHTERPPNDAPVATLDFRKRYGVALCGEA